jgi:uncharacterized protein YjbJ (UPF0337 family)
MTNSTEATEASTPAETSTPTLATTTAPSGATATARSADATVTTQQVKGNWNEQKGKLKAQFSTLTDADLHYENGKKDEMFTKIQVKIGKSKEELAAIISAL